MSSVTRFIRQVPVSTTYYSAAGLFDSAGLIKANTVYQFVPSGSNYVGNYPNPYPDSTGGYMSNASSTTALGVALSGAYFSASAGTGLILRDMGKTIFAPYSTSSATTWAYFRQVQLLKPSNIDSASQGFIGGAAGSTFGVLGAANTPDNNTDYLTFYIPVSIAGVAVPNIHTGAYALAGGQM